MARVPSRSARGRERSDPPQRCRRPATSAAALGPSREGVSVCDRSRRRVVGRLVRRALAVARLSLHVRTRILGRLPVVLGDRRRLQRLRGPPRAPRRRADRRLTRPARRARGLPATDGLDVSLGIVTRQRLQLRFQHLVHRGGISARGRSTTTTARRTRPGSASGVAAEHAAMCGTDTATYRPRTTRHECRSRSRTEPSTTHTRRMRAAWTGCGGCINGSTGRRRDATRAERGSAVETSTQAPSAHKIARQPATHTATAMGRRAEPRTDRRQSDA